MRVPSYGDANRGRMDTNMTPMIDVVFQLLIFFVCTVSFQALEEVLPTNLRAPGAGAGATALDPALAELEDAIIRIEREGAKTHWSLSSRNFATLPELRAVLGQLAQLRADLPVILDSQPDVPLGDVIDTYDMCRVIGFDKIQFAAHTPVNPAPPTPPAGS